MPARVYPRFPVSLRRPSVRYGAKISLEGVEYRGRGATPREAFESAAAMAEIFDGIEFRGEVAQPRNPIVEDARAVGIVVKAAAKRVVSVLKKGKQ